jgi:2-methylcitrate dehydratase
LTVKLTDGRTLVKEVEFPRGHAHNPMSDAEVEMKFRAAVEPRFGKDTADRILATCWNLDKLNRTGELLEMIR